MKKQEHNLSSGIIQFNGDNPGIFIKSQDAAYYSLVLRDLTAKYRGVKSLAVFSPEQLAMQVEKLLDLFSSCNDFMETKMKVKHLKSFEECRE